MPKTSVSCRRNPEPRCRRRGFTLLEILVVLALVALVSGLVAPSAMNALAAARERGLVADVRALLEGLPVQAFREGRQIDVDGAALARQLELPEGWVLQVEGPLVYSDTGICSGGVVRLSAPGGATRSWRIATVSGVVAAAALP